MIFKERIKLRVSSHIHISPDLFPPRLIGSGIMFPVKCKDLLPVDHLVIKSVSVRGRLGPLTVWVSNNEETVVPIPPVAGAASRRSCRRRNNNNNGIMARDPSHNRLRVERDSENDRTENSIDLHPSSWTKLYDKTHGASRRDYVELVLDQPIRLKPGETRVLYIHSTLPGDEAIVYDNSYYGTTSKRFEDDKLAILTGRAHVSTRVFGQDPIWGTYIEPEPGFGDRRSNVITPVVRNLSYFATHSRPTFFPVYDSVLSPFSSLQTL